MHSFRFPFVALPSAFALRPRPPGPPRPRAMVVVLDPFLESRFRHLEGLREQLHALQGAIAAQQVRVIDQHNAVQLAVEQGVSSIRDDLRSLHGSINARRATLTRLRGHTSDIGGLAEAVSAAASGATETLRRDRWRESWLPSARLTPPGSPSPVVSAAASWTPSRKSNS